ncbi:MAG: hypothetical protein ACM3H7_06900 [Acidobacteriaceae bacterium]
MEVQIYRNNVTKPIALFSLLAVAALILAACAPAAAPSQPASSGSTVTLNVATNPILGKILVDDTGKTLYIFTKDAPDSVNCDATCLQNWPPLVSSGTAKAGPGVDAALIGTATLPSGEKIVTYAHQPLYYFFKDAQPGDISGEDVGSVWFVISPDGLLVMPPSSATPTAAPTAAVSEPTLMVVTDPKLGAILVDDKGMTLYAFTKDGPDQSNCSGNCLTNWPPLLTQGSPHIGAGVDDSKVGSALLADGTQIVTYNHLPLYYFYKDAKPGDTSGEDVGSVWYVVSPDGQLVLPASNAVSTQAPVSAASEPTLMVATDPKLGEFLVDGNGMTLYIFTKDSPDKSNCTGSCLTNWPPLLTQGSPKLGSGIDDSKIGTALLADGTHIVTYNHLPLYYYIKDSKPGDTSGQGVGGVWYVLSPDGEMITR